MQSKNGKNVLTEIIIELNKGIVEKHKHDILVMDLASEYKMLKLTLSF